MKTARKPKEHEPWDIDVEIAVLGAMLRDNQQIDVASSDMDGVHFYDPLHARMFDMIVALYGEGGGVTPLILHSVMKADPGVIETGGQAYFDALRAAAPAIPQMREWVRILLDLAMRRELQRIATELATAAIEPPDAGSAQDIAHDATEALLRISEMRDKGPSHLAVIAQASVIQAQEHLAGKPIPSISTGLESLDKALGGMQPGDRIGLPGRTGMGKSLTASAIVNGAARDGAPVFLASADMRSKQWADRALCDIDNFLHPHERPIYYSKFRNGTLSSEELFRIGLAQKAMEEMPIEIDDNPSISLASVRARARAMSKRFPNKQGLLVVDFLQKVEPAKNSYQDRRRDEDLTHIAYGLGDIVRSIGWTLLALVQMKNKDTDSKGNMREDPPNVTDIRESGGIEMAFDIIISPFRKAFFIERREPEGRDDTGGPSVAWLGWRAEQREYQNKLRMLGFKNRDGCAADLNLDLWCDPGCAAVRDFRPSQTVRPAEDQDLEADLLGYHNR